MLRTMVGQRFPADRTILLETTASLPSIFSLLDRDMTCKCAVNRQPWFPRGGLVETVLQIRQQPTSKHQNCHIRYTNVETHDPEGVQTSRYGVRDPSWVADTESTTAERKYGLESEFRRQKWISAKIMIFDQKVDLGVAETFSCGFGWRARLGGSNPHTFNSILYKTYRF